MTPRQLLALLRQPGTVLLDTVGKEHAHSRWLYTHPVKELKLLPGETVDAYFEHLMHWSQKGYALAGYLSYEAGFAFQDLPLPARLPYPLAWFGVYKQPTPVPQSLLTEALTRLSASFAIYHPRWTYTDQAYEHAFNQVKRAIYEGETYQINLTDRLSFRFIGHPLALYHALRQRQQAAYAAYLHLPFGHILSLSPELFFAYQHPHIQTRPMKGTAPRGKNPAEDQALKQALYRSEKNRAENVMIVDLLRNDLSRCCLPNSVQVPHLFSLEPYETVWQMTSTIEGILSPHATLRDIFQALFPCGSITGAPKRRAMQYIQHIEPTPRGIYCGAIGHIPSPTRASFNVAIRTLFLQRNQGTLGTGGGIVWDSSSREERRELQTKVQFFTSLIRPNSFYLIESMRWEHNRIPLWRYHLTRLRQAAQALGFPFQESYLSDTLQKALQHLTSNGPHKVRLCLYPDGKVNLSATPLHPFKDTWRVMLAPVPDDFLPELRRYKTSLRQSLDQAYLKATRQGKEEVLFISEDGFLTEGSRTTLYVWTGKELLTPPLSAGILPGVFRSFLKDNYPLLREHPLTVQDVQQAAGVYLSNAVRGWIRVQEITDAQNNCWYTYREGTSSPDIPSPFASRTTNYAPEEASSSFDSPLVAAVSSEVASSSVRDSTSS